MRVSKRQQAIIDFIKNEVRDKGYPPSVREIGDAVGLASSSTVHGHLARLEQKGLIRRDATKPRAIEILEDVNTSSGFEFTPVYAPVIGKVTAGLPITAVENVEEYFPLPPSYAGEHALYLLHVQGDSMIEAGILDKDLVIVRQQASANNGDIVVAMTEEDEATVKRFFKENNRIRLQPENSTMDAMYFQNVTILGKVIGVFRTLQ